MDRCISHIHRVTPVATTGSYLPSIYRQCPIKRRNLPILASARGRPGLPGYCTTSANMIPDFQLRLDGNLISVEHSIAGAALVLTLAKAPRDKVMAELIAHAIAGHHAGLPDRIGGASSLSERLQRADLDRLAPVWRTEIAPVASDLLPAFATRKW